MTRRKGTVEMHDTRGAVWTPPVAIDADLLARVNGAFHHAGIAMPEGFIGELGAAAGEYRALESRQQKEPPPGQKRDSVARIASLSRELRQALNALDEDSADSLADSLALISGEYPPPNAAYFLDMLKSAAARVPLPKTRPKDEAKAIAAVRLWALFEKHGIPFTGYDINEYGLPGGPAAACLRAVFGEPDIRVGRWLEHALKNAEG